MLRRFIFSLALCVLTCGSLHVVPAGALAKSRAEQSVLITEGVGIGDIFVDKSTKADVLAKYGHGFKLIQHNEYSSEMEYADAGLSFYYCLKDEKEKIFLIEVRRGQTSKGIVIGQSTLKDVQRVYGAEAPMSCDSETCVYEYKGVQFYVKADPPGSEENPVDPLPKKIIEIDVVPPDKSSNFCDNF